MPTQPTDSARKQASNNLSRQIAQYSLAAAAAGVSTLALSQPADAKVVITNKNIPIPFCFALFPCSVSLDLNGDGVNDLKFSLISSYTYSAHSLQLHVAAHNGGGVVGTAGGAHGPYASPLLRGAHIGPSDHFSGGKDTVEVSYRHYDRSGELSNLKLYGKWGANHPNRFLGVKFKINGTTHFGWVRITVNVPSPSCVPLCSTDLSATITEYGYETVANKSLGAGLASDSADDQAQAIPDEPSRPSLGMLAFGADGLAIWRREEALVH
jgi:hypothetical protein